MAKIKLRDYQVEAVNFTQKVDKSLLCMRVGSGKTVCAMFAIREYFKRKKVDKAIIACTKSSVSVFQQDFKEKAGLNVKLIESTSELIDFLKGDEKICIVKHSMFEKAGNDLTVIKQLEKLYMLGLRTALVIDEAHKIQNPDGLAQEAYHRIDFMFDKVILLTATPYSSCLSQFYGLICVIYPDLWKNKKAFFDMYIDEIAIRDRITHRVVRKEKIRYKNLKHFRKMIEPFTYFYYPPIPLVHVEHHTRLRSYEEYNKLCLGIMKEEDLEKLKAKKLL